MSKGLWFKEKKLGIGLEPNGWKGWVSTAIYITAVFSIPHLAEDRIVVFPAIIILTMVFVFILYRKSPIGSKNQDE